MPQKIWHQCLEVLRDEFPAQQFNTWLRPLQPELSDGNLVLFAPNRFVMDWVNQKYLRRIEEVIKDLEGGQAPRVNMKVGSATRSTQPAPDGPAAPEPRSRVSGSGSAAMDYRRRNQSTNDADEPGRVTEEEKGVAASVPGGSARRSSVQVEGDIKHQSFLNEGFTFDTFVEGKSNQLAIDMYTKMGYSVYRQVIGYYSGEEDAYDMRKPLSRDVERKSAIPLPHPVHPDELD